jgi:cytochrome c peroxidase
VWKSKLSKLFTSPVAYGNANYEQAEKKLVALGYQPWFDKAFPGEAKALSAENWGKAIGAFERTLLTPAPFDRYLKGDGQALSAQAKQGLKTFMDTGCAGCRQWRDRRWSKLPKIWCHARLLAGDG